MKYILIPVANLTEAMTASAITFGGATMRTSNDGSQAILKVNEPVPSVFDGLTQYDLAGIQAIVAGPDWQSTETDDE